MLLKGADIVTSVLIEQGVTDVFGYPGGAALDLYDSLYMNRDKINHYMSAHEQGASHAADGYARATGKIGVVISTSGPGATNLVTGIATAYMDSSPLLAISCNVGTKAIGKDSFQEIFITGVTTPITKHNFAVRHVEYLAQVLRQAIKIAQSGRKGPVMVDIPKDVLNATCDYEPADPVVPDPVDKANSEQIMELAALINESSRPVILFGGGVISNDASDLLVDFINKANIPACHTIMGTGILGYGDELDLGMVGMHGSVLANRAVNNCDLLIAVGTRFSDRVALKTDSFASKAKIVQIDIDPSENGKNVSVDSFIIGNVKEILKELLPQIKKCNSNDWIDSLAELRKDEYMPKVYENILRPYDVMKVLSEETGDDTIFVTDVGQHQMWAAQYCKKTRARGFLTSGGLGTMGFGYGAAIGAKVALPKSTVIHITGDGSFHMNMNEACTAVSNNLQVITVIMDNRVLGMVHQWQEILYNRHFMCTEPERKTDYVKVIEGFGGKGYIGDTTEQLRNALHEALKYNGPSWIVCHIDPEERVLPMIPPGKTVEETILQEEVDF